MAALIRTLFAPFKQSYNNVGGAIDVRIHAFFDNIISRFVGFFARSFLLFVGAVIGFFVLVSGIVFVAVWPLIPLAIPISLLLMVLGVGK